MGVKRFALGLAAGSSLTAWAVWRLAPEIASRVLDLLLGPPAPNWEWSARTMPPVPDRYFIRLGDRDAPEHEVTAKEFVAAERAAGFTPKPGCGPFATAGFASSRGSTTISGRIERDGDS